MSSNVDRYIQAFSAQRGSGFPIYMGAPYMRGGGFGDVLRGLFRRIVPVIAKNASSFLSGFTQGNDRGLSLKEAAKEAVRPALSTTVKSGIEEWNRFQEEKERERGRAQQATELNKQQGSGVHVPTFDALPFQNQKVYKRKKKRSHKSKRKSRKLNPAYSTNF
jgi:hypothetical protein